MNLVVGVADSDTTGQRLVKQIEALAKERGISQKELLRRARLADGAPAAGTTSFNSWKIGETSPTVEKLEALCAVIGKRLAMHIGGASTQRAELGLEAVEAAERINHLPQRDRERIRDAVYRLAASVERARGSVKKQA